MLTPDKVKTGSLIVSEPFMYDPNFKRSVVFMTEYTEDGAIGYVLNQQSNLLLKDIIEECEASELSIYTGGPVAVDTLHFIHCCYDRMNSGIDMGNGVYWGGNFEALKLLINNNQIEENEIRFFIGYSGWGKEQLDMELKENAWLVTNTYDAGILFESNSEKLWRDVVVNMGPKYAHIVNFPENPMWN